MKALIVNLFLFFQVLQLFAQDTVKVQTFNWQSTNRRDTFLFPDVQGEKYRKILMVYNMRCHDAAVGSGSVGCYEWDYSCNTFITDPTRRDSVLSYSPKYVISNTSGKTFPYTDGPTYSYTLYNQHQTILSGNVTESVEYSTGDQQLNFMNNNRVGKIQSIFTAEELNLLGLTAGSIQRMQLNFLTSGGNLDFMKIKMKHTSKLNFDVRNPDTDDLTEVYFRNSSFSLAGWQSFDFYQPFIWNGTDNVIVELSYSSPLGASPIVLGAHETGSQRSLISLKEDNALDFSGAQFVEIPSNNLNTIGNEITISLWCKGDPSIMPAVSTLFEGIDSKNSRQVNVHLPWENSNVYWDCGGKDGSFDRINKLANPIDFEGRWNHWAFTKNAVTGMMRIYLNGVLWHSGMGLKRPIDLKALKLGSGYFGSPSYFGQIDALQIWNKALEAATINQLMFDAVTPVHPDYSFLKYHYEMNEGIGNSLGSDLPGSETAKLEVPNWTKLKGAQLFKQFDISSERYDVRFEKGNFTKQDQVVAVLDSAQNAPNRVIQYGLLGTDLTALDTVYLFKAGMQYVFDELGVIVDSVNFATTGTIIITDLAHYTKTPAKFELLSLVTPYGNGLDLGKNGKTFTFDVTDYAPVLKGKRFISIEYGGEFQEELDIEFLFIKGTPPADVVNVQNIWRPDRGYFNQIQNDNIFEPRNMKLSNQANTFKIKSAITGHGQNGEFVPRQHYIDIDGGVQDYTYDVWKYCGKNPIFPQGGTWVFDRAGWCPGMATDVNEFFIESVSPGSVMSIDYGVNGPDLSEANYLVSNQLVSYGNFYFANDASIERIMRPNNQEVEFERLNPSCNTPTIKVKNTGSQTITSLEIEYQVQGGNSMNYIWTGQLLPLRNTDVILPLNSLGFWFNNGEKKVFYATIKKVNGVADQYAANNSAKSFYTTTPEYSFTDPIQIKVLTNNKGVDNSYTIKDSDGNVVVTRNNMLNNTVYTDEIDVPTGCYTMAFEDSEGDGLSFWFFPNNGSGTLKLERIFNGSNIITLRTFNPDMGGGVQFDFVRGKVTSTEEDISSYTLLSLWPNPASTFVNLELHGFGNGSWRLELTDINGKFLINKEVNLQGDKNIIPLNVENLEQGMYYLNINNGKKSWVKPVLIQR